MPGAGDQHRADDQVGPADAVEDVVPVAEQRRHVRRHHVVEVAQPVEVDVEDDDVRAEAGRDLGGVGADDAAAEDDDVGRQHARHAAEQDAAALERPLQVLRPFLDAHPAGDLAHRRQQRQAAAGVLDRLVGDGRDARRHHRPRQPFVGGEVEVGEDDLLRRASAAIRPAAAP